MAYQPSLVDQFGIRFHAEVSNAIARSKISGGVIGVMLGKVTTSSAGTEVALRATAFTDQTAGAQRSVSSSSANDASAGTGARTIKITYYTISGSTVSGPSTETIILNGTTTVNTTATNIALVEKIEVLTVGSGGTNAGTISLFGSTAGGGGTIASIATGDKNTRLGHHFVPSGNTCFITDLILHNNAASGNTAEFVIKVVNPTSTTACELNQMVIRSDGRASLSSSLRVPMAVVGPARIRMYVTPENAASQISSCDISFLDMTT